VTDMVRVNWNEYMYRDSPRIQSRSKAPGCKYYRTNVYVYGMNDTVWNGGMDTLLLVDYDITVQYYLYRPTNT
jgi:hypothetical protein